ATLGGDGRHVGDDRALDEGTGLVAQSGGHVVLPPLVFHGVGSGRRRLRPTRPVTRCPPGRVPATRPDRCAPDYRAADVGGGTPKAPGAGGGRWSTHIRRFRGSRPERPGPA